MPRKKITPPKHRELLKKVTDVRKRVTAVSRDVSTVLAKVKKSYKSLDPATRKKIALGIAGLGSILAVTALQRRRKAK